MQGIYEIHCIKTGRKYIGSSKNVDRRWDNHLNALRRGDHHNYKLQKAYITYGEDNLVFSVLEFVEEEKDLYKVEEKYIKQHTFSKLFNVLRKPGIVPRYKSRWMNYCKQSKGRQTNGKKEEWAWGD